MVPRPERMGASPPAAPMLIAPAVGASSSTAEQRTLNPQVLGSNPRGRTTTTTHHRRRDAPGGRVIRADQTSGPLSIRGSMGAGSVVKGGKGPFE